MMIMMQDVKIDNKGCVSKVSRMDKFLVLWGNGTRNLSALRYISIYMLVFRW